MRCWIWPSGLLEARSHEHLEHREGRVGRWIVEGEPCSSTRSWPTKRIELTCFGANRMGPRHDGRKDEWVPERRRREGNRETFAWKKWLIGLHPGSCEADVDHGSRAFPPRSLTTKYDTKTYRATAVGTKVRRRPCRASSFAAGTRGMAAGMGHGAT
jgi:hypothetical protein